jgi:hypothetical protein
MAMDNPSINRQQLLSHCSGIALQWLDQQLLDYLDKLEEQLFQLSEKADNNNEQCRFFQTRQTLHEQRNVLRQLLKQHLQQALQAFQQGRQTCSDFQLQQADEDKLALVDNDVLEENIAIRSMVRRSSADCSVNLYALNQRLAALMAGNKIIERLNPFAPGVFAEGLQFAIADLVVDNHAKLVVYKCFDRELIQQLNTLYTEINDLLKEQGVLPNLRHTVVKDPDEELPDELRVQQQAASLLQQVALLKAIQQAQQRWHQQHPRPANAVTLNTTQLVSVIQQLQQASRDQLNQLDSPEAIANSNLHAIRQQLQHQASQTEELDSDVIELVGLLFDYMLNDPQLPDSVKTLLSYLHTPYIKAALQDREFFQQPQHPARQLLNSLVAAGQRWVESGQRKNEVFQRIHSTVQTVLNDFDQDARLFSELAFNFNHFLREHARRVRLTEQRSLQATEGEHKLKEIRLKIGRFLDKKTAGLDLPEAVQTLLYEPWVNVLSFNLLRFGSHSEQWRHSAQAINDILAFAHLSDLDEALIPAQSPLFKVLQQGFQTVGYDSQQGQQLLSQLEALHHQHNVQAKTLCDTDIEQLHIAPPGHIDEQALAQLQAIKPGNWLLFNKGQDNEKRLKLTWSNPSTLHFMFVNKLGQQAQVKDGCELARDLDTGRAEVLGPIDEKPFFEQAMERVLKQLEAKTQQQNNKPQGSTI